MGLGFIFLLSFIFNSQALADDTCSSFKKINNYKHHIENKCLGLVLDSKDVPWDKPRRILFNEDNSKIFVSDMGGWSNRNSGKVWEVNLKTKAFKIIYEGGDWTHGLQKDSSKRLLVGDTNKVIRRKRDNTWETIISNLPSKGSHPLSHFILLPNDDLILNIGAPSNDCSQGFSDFHCAQRDIEGELRHYKYEMSSDSYKSDYKVLGRGLRNSMALLFNQMTNELYQAENNIDKFGTPEEFNLLSLDENIETYDFGWPFCFGMNQEYVFPVNSGIGPNTFSSFCRRVSTSPLFLIPAHSSPLDMIYYQGSEHSLENKILMSWHGHRRSEEYALVSYDTNSFNEPLFQGNGLNSFTPLISGIGSSDSDKLRPVGLQTDKSGRIWIVDDIQNRILLYAHTDSNDTNTTNDDEPLNNNQEIAEHLNGLSSTVLNQFESIYSDFFAVQTCTQCHGPSEIPDDSNLALETFYKRGWFALSSETDLMTFFRRTSKDAEKSMPPPPEQAFELSHPTVFNNLREWVQKNNP